MMSRHRFLMLLVGTQVCAVLARAQAPTEIRAYIERHKAMALEQERLYGIPAPVTLAQGILESGAGKSTLARKANNHFGIKKGVGWSGRLFYAWDDDPLKSAFRAYVSAEASYEDHSLFLRGNSRYGSLFSKSVYDYRGWAFGLQKAGYATSPTYAKALIGFIDSYRLYAINGGVKLRPGKTVTITRTVTREELVVRTDWQYGDAESSEEQESLDSAIQRFVVAVNGVRCTILYPGETLLTVALKYNLPKSKLLEYNETTDENDIREGDIVFLERKKSKFRGAQDFYKAKEGDTLYGVSQKFGIRLSSLARLNRMGVFASLTEGEKLKLK